MSGGRSEKKTDFWGNEYIQHYDDRGQPIGRSEVKTDFFGNTYTQHYDNSGRSTGTSEQRESFFGGTYTQHYDSRGQATGTSEQRESFFGGTYTQHYDNRGRATGTSEQRETFFGNTYIQHTGTSGTAYYPNSTSSASSQNSRPNVEYLGSTSTPTYTNSSRSRGTAPIGFHVSITSGIGENCAVLFFVGVVMLFATLHLIRLYDAYPMAYPMLLSLYAIVSSIICLFTLRKKHGLKTAGKFATFLMAAANASLLISATSLFEALLYPGSIEHFVDFLRTVRFWLPLAIHALVLGLITVFTLGKAGEQELSVRKVSAGFRTHAICSYTAVYGIVIYMADRLGDPSGWFLWTIEVILMFLFLCAITSAAIFVSNIPYVIFCKYPKKAR